ncbi:transcriptional regulatory protein ZraR [Luteitalea sp. TBR-22]|nr:transcriptional regulatory protein ZraR [Luteitalea sp. TBR-22]
MAESAPPDLVVTECVFGAGENGADVINAMRRASDHTRVLVISSAGTLDGAVEAFRAGAADYLGKPCDPHLLRAAVDRALAQPTGTGHPAAAAALDERLLGRAPATLHLRRHVQQAASASAPVLIVGESGSGKHRVARALHAEGPRASGPFLSINCAALSDTQAASALFGHVAGVNSGDSSDTPGAFVQAAGGTLLLDNVSELSLGMQDRLLRVLQDRTVRAAGADAPVPVDARVVATTGADIEGAIAAARFRQGLFFRLAVFLIRVPPLRDRRQDIPLLVEHFSRDASQRAGRVVTFSGGAIARLRQLDWPGNVRELENVIERLVVSARNPVVDARDVGVDAPAGTPAGAHPFVDMPTLDELERRYLVYALQRFAGNRTRTAAALGIDRRTLYRMSARLGVPITGADLQSAAHGN